MLTRLVNWWKNLDKRIIYFPIGIIVVSIFIFLLLYLPAQQAETRRLALNDRVNRLKWETTNETYRHDLDRDLLTAEKDLAAYETASRTTLAQIMGGLFVIFGAYLAWRNVKAKEEGNVTERFSKAVEMLGNDQMDVRIGGIYALERIANDSFKDHWTVIEVLTAFLRGIRIDESDISPIEKIIKDEIPRISADAQAALSIIGRRKWISKESQQQILDFRGAKLPHADLDGLNFTNANFERADLRHAVISDSNFANAWLHRTELEGARIRRSNFNGVNLSQVNLSKADVEETTFIGSKTDSANFEQIMMYKVDFSGSLFYSVEMMRAKLQETSFRGSGLLGSDVEDAEFWEVDLRGADLGVWMDSWVQCIDESQLRNCIMDEFTVLPPSFRHIQDEMLGGHDKDQELGNRTETPLRTSAAPKAAATDEPKPGKPRKSRKNSSAK